MKKLSLISLSIITLLITLWLFFIFIFRPCDSTDSCPKGFYCKTVGPSTTKDGLVVGEFAARCFIGKGE